MFGMFLILILVVGVLLIRGSKTQEEQKIKVGAVYPLSGPLAVYGVEYQRGLEMAAEELNDQGGVNGKQIQIIFEDDEGDVLKSVSAVNKLINVDRLKFLFTGFSSPSQATAPIAEQSQVLYISQTVSRIGTGNYVFRDYWDMEDQGVAIGKAITNDKIAKLGIIALTYGDTEAFLAGLRSQVGDIRVEEHRFQFGDADFKMQISALKRFDPDGILVYGFPGNETIQITKQLVEFGFDSKRLYSGSTVYSFPFMTSQFTGTLKKMKAVDTWFPVDTESAKRFAQKYRERYGEDVNGDAMYPYDDLYALKLAMETGGTGEDTKKIAGVLHKIEYNGVAGKLVFDEKGNSQRNVYLQQFTETGWKKYEVD